MKNFFENCKSLDELKAEFRRLVKRYHPDCGGDAETMKAVNNQYEIAFEQLKKQHNERADAEHQTTETPDEFRNIILALLNLDGVTVELCGSWLWLSGKTYDHKDALKALGCRWSSSKKMWYWRHAEDGHKWHRGNKSLSQIRAKYGSQVFKGATETTGFEQIAGATA